MHFLWKIHNAGMGFFLYLFSYEENCEHLNNVKILFSLKHIQANFKVVAFIHKNLLQRHQFLGDMLQNLYQKMWKSQWKKTLLQKRKIFPNPHAKVLWVRRSCPPLAWIVWSEVYFVWSSPNLSCWVAGTYFQIFWIYVFTSGKG